MKVHKISNCLYIYYVYNNPNSVTAAVSLAVSIIAGDATLATE